MNMTGKERKIWLEQISRIHRENEIQRQNELSQQLNSIMEADEQYRQQ